MVELEFDRNEDRHRVEIRIRKNIGGRYQFLYVRFPTPTILDADRSVMEKIEWTPLKEDADFFAIGFVFADAFSWLVALHRTTQKMFK